MDAVQGELITAGSTNATALNLTDVGVDGARAFILKVISGTIKYGNGAVDANAHGWTSADDVPPITCKNGQFYFQAASAVDTFVVTAIS